MGEKHGFDKPLGGFIQPKSAADASTIRGHFVAATGEFVGTFMFLLMAFLGHQMAASQSVDSAHQGTASSATIIYIGMAYGFSLLVTVWTFYRISGGLFNPAVTLGLIITGALPAIRGLLLIPVQFLSAICAAAVVSAIIPADIRIVQTTLAPNVSVAQGLFIEMFLTAYLVFVILMLAAEKSKDTFIAPIGIGLALWVAEIAGVYYTGGSLNPARSFGPCVAAAYFDSYHWIYWIGPVLGALVSAGYYHFVKFFNYEDANPGQDSAGGDLGEEVTQEISRSKSDPARLEGGEAYGRSRSMDPGMVERGEWDGPNDVNGMRNRPKLDSRIESGTMHPGFTDF